MIKIMEQAFKDNPNNYPEWYEFDYDDEKIKTFVSELLQTHRFSDSEILDILKCLDTANDESMED